MAAVMPAGVVGALERPASQPKRVQYRAVAAEPWARRPAATMPTTHAATNPTRATLDPLARVKLIDTPSPGSTRSAAQPRQFRLSDLINVPDRHLE